MSGMGLPSITHFSCVSDPSTSVALLNDSFITGGEPVTNNQIINHPYQNNYNYRRQHENTDIHARVHVLTDKFDIGLIPC